jgi:hypothetical protein
MARPSAVALYLIRLHSGGFMLPIRAITPFFLLLFAGNVAAADYSLYENIIKFKAPSEWPVIIEKKEGNPQFIAFQIRDPADPANNEMTQVTINARLMHDSSFFQQQVDAATDKAKQLPGFELATAADPNVFRYYAMNGKTRYEYRETFYLVSHLLLHIRCVRPMLAETTQAWTDAYDKNCADLMHSLKPK